MKKESNIAAELLQSKLKLKMKYDQKLRAIHLEIQVLLDQLEDEITHILGLIEKNRQHDAE